MFFPKSDNDTKKETKEASTDASTQTTPKVWEKSEEQKLTEFRDEARRIFLNEWLCCDGDWLSTMDKDHLDFIRDLLGIERSDNFEN